MSRALCLVRQVYHEAKINPAWGAYWIPCESPPEPHEAILAELEDCPEFELVPNFPRLPAELWTALIKLYRYCCTNLEHGPNQEVSVRLLRSETDASQWKVIVPIQSVSSVSVRAHDFNHAVDLLSGEEYSSFPPEGWLSAGSSHSHNSMSTFFSAVDDGSELDDPGLHFVVGHIRPTEQTQSILASIVQKYNRYIVPTESVVDTTELEDVTFHPNVIKYIHGYRFNV